MKARAAEARRQVIEQVWREIERNQRLGLYWKLSIDMQKPLPTRECRELYFKIHHQKNPTPELFATFKFV